MIGYYYFRSIPETPRLLFTSDVRVYGKTAMALM